MMTWLLPLAGGALIGLAAVVMMATLGRIAGISGIFGQVLPPVALEGLGWRLAFIVGLVLGPAGAALVLGRDPIGAPVVDLPVLAVAGLLVGVGTALGSGCTSGHGVCGLARLSPRSLAATITFMATAMVTVFVVHHLHLR